MLRIHAIGRFRVEVDGEDRTSPAFDRATALLAWLALNPGLHARSAVASRFWPDVLDESARASLRSALWSLRRQLGEQANGALVATRERVGLTDGVWVDAAEADRLEGLGRLEEALELGEGELLPGFEDEWVHDAREEHEARTASLLERLAEAAEAEGELGRAVELSRRAAALTPLSEESHRALMRRLAAAGDRSGSLAVYGELRTRLLQTIRIGPSDETRRLADTLRTETPATPVPAQLARVDTALFFGRATELERLRRLSERGEAVKVALIAGEAGSGKTRLAARYAVECAADGKAVLYGACGEQALVPYEPFADAVGVPGDTALDAAAIEERLAAIPGDRLLLVLDDLQWADRATLALLGRVVRGHLSERLAVVGAYREDEAEAHLYGAVSDLRRHCEVDRIELGGLELADVAALIGSAFETSAAAAQARAIHDRTGGNPFYVASSRVTSPTGRVRRSATFPKGSAISFARASSASRRRAPRCWPLPRCSVKRSTSRRCRLCPASTTTRSSRSSRRLRQKGSWKRSAPAATGSRTRSHAMRCTQASGPAGAPGCIVRPRRRSPRARASSPAPSWPRSRCTAARRRSAGTGSTTRSSSQSARRTGRSRTGPTARPCAC